MDVNQEIQNLKDEVKKKKKRIEHLEVGRNDVAASVAPVLHRD